VRNILKEVAEIGRICGEEWITDIFTQAQINKSKNGEISLKMICINFDKNGKYVDTDLEDYNPTNKEKYYYRRGSPNGPNYSPVCIITTAEKSFNGKIKRWFDEYGNNDELLSKIKSEIEMNKVKIIDDINSIKEKYKNSKIIFALGVKVDNKHMGEFDNFKNIINKIYESRKKEHKSKRRAKGEQGICMVCNNSTLVYPVSVSDVFPFATIEKKGFLTNLSEEEAWKNISVCLDCSKNLSKGKNFLDKYLNFQIYGQINFYIIPKYITSNIDNRFLEEIRKIRLAENRDENLIKSFITEEDNFYNQFLQDADILSFIYLFYKRRREKMIILGMSEEVYPSRIKKIFDAMENSTNCFIFKEEFLKKIFGKKYEGRIEFKSLGIEFVEFFPLSRMEDESYELEFVDVINSILSDIKINKEFLFSQFMKFIKKDFISSKNKKLKKDWRFKNINAIKIFKFLNSLYLIDSSYGGNMIDSEEKKVSFLVGVYVSKLLKEQYEIRGDTPFIKKLYGLNLNEAKIKELFKKVYNKLMEYNKVHYYNWLAQKISESFIKIKDGWKLRDDEVSFYFVCGLALGKGLNEENLDKLLRGEL
jgi:CRISPR-associated protein Csh1